MSVRRRNLAGRRVGPATYWRVTANILLRTGALSCALLIAAALAAPAYAQSADLPPPTRQQTDGNGVDLTRAAHMVSVTDIAIGPEGRGGLAYVRQLERAASRNSYDMGVFVLNFDWTATFGLQTYAFTLSGGTYTSTDGSGATLTFGSGAYTLTLSDGTVLADILNGPSTTMAGLRSFQNLGGNSSLNQQQRNLIGTYIRELPSTPLNMRVQAAWRNWLGG